MALDHVRDFIHDDAAKYNPLDLTKTSPFLFFTRWITHFCAPNFVMLAGIGAFIYGSRNGTKSLQRFLLTRGLWLMILEPTIITLGWSFDPLYHTLIFQVIFAIGISMVILSGLVGLKPYIILTIGLGIEFLHNILDYFPSSAIDQKQGFFLDLILYKHPQGYTLFQGHSIMVFYSFLSFLGMMLVGYSIGVLFTSKYSSQERRSYLVRIGMGMLGAFILIRFINIYGDPDTWKGQKDFLYTLLDFIRVQKYPPSLDYFLMTNGIGVLILAAFNEARGWFFQVLKVYGQVPFFYYILHIYIIHLTSVILFNINGFGLRSAVPGAESINDIGFPLYIVYLVWLAVLALLYPLCVWYSGYKKTHNHWWLKYI